FWTDAGDAPNGAQPDVVARAGVYSFENGVAVIPGFVLYKAESDREITATVDNAGEGGNVEEPENGVTGSTSANVPANLMVTPGPADALETTIAQDPGTPVTADGATNVALTITVRDEYGN